MRFLESLRIRQTVLVAVCVLASGPSSEAFAQEGISVGDKPGVVGKFVPFISLGDDLVFEPSRRKVILPFPSDKGHGAEEVQGDLEKSKEGEKGVLKINTGTETATQTGTITHKSR